MPKRTPATMEIVENFVSYGKLHISLEELKDRVEKGEKLIYEESLFSDPGDDWTALYLNNKQVGYWGGY